MNLMKTSGNSPSNITISGGLIGKPSSVSVLQKTVTKNLIQCRGKYETKRKGKHEVLFLINL